MDVLEREKFRRKVRPEVWGSVNKMRELKRLGQTDKEIEKIVHDLRLPLGLHMFILGHYSDLMDN